MSESWYVKNYIFTAQPSFFFSLFLFAGSNEGEGEGKTTTTGMGDKTQAD